MAKSRTVFFCSECGNETLKWQGKCPHCGAWNTIVEHKEAAAPARRTSGAVSGGFAPVLISDIDFREETRFSTGMDELDRVLGGGAVNGSLVLIGGAPGVGKSTLLLQLCAFLSAERKILYVSGEESARQIKMRAERLGSIHGELYITIETRIAEILNSVKDLAPDIVVIDSVQTVYNEALDTAPGSVVHVKDCTMALMRLAKENGITVFVVGHVNKEGSIAGPKVLEHMVDCVLYFEGEQGANYRILRAAKNRFGSTNEIGVFEMLGDGLREVPNPSETLLAGRPENAPGTCVTCVIEGSRPILAEIQALVANTSFNVPRRTSNGLDYNRCMLLLAVLEKRGGLRLSNCDAYINVIGGLQLDEPFADLAAVLAIASSFTDRPVDHATAAVGEVGLTGEIRAVNSLEQRLKEIRRLGFESCIIPARNKGKYKIPDGLKIYEVKNISEALSISIGAKRA
ncbi:MAG: DNA repair protein RadA [Oscillospiraceae bacterium]|nr:DNA repair protein RadA [Oscillospiraceae bacterium]